MIPKSGYRFSEKDHAPVKPTLLYYIRHGETDWNVEGRLQGRQDTDLNAAGRQQAHACAGILRELVARDGRATTEFAYISSPLRRARETMEIMRAALGMDRDAYRVEPRLREIEFGEWEGMTLAEVRARAAEALARR